MEVAIVLVALVAYYGFREWLRHQRTMLAHRERLAAIEKGIELPTLEHEVVRRSWNVQRILLLAGLIWISLGLVAFITLSAIAGALVADNVPPGIKWIGLAGVGIGVSHLIVFLVGRDRERVSGPGR